MDKLRVTQFSVVNSIFYEAILFEAFKGVCQVPGCTNTPVRLWGHWCENPVPKQCQVEGCEPTEACTS
jgi:hypothetical protein